METLDAEVRAFATVAILTLAINEIGLRMALSAQRSDILKIVKIVMGEGAPIVVFGVAAGPIGSVILTRVLQIRFRNPLFLSLLERSPLVQWPNGRQVLRKTAIRKGRP
jgi:hypothetical protein